MWCPTCQADVAAELTPDQRRLLCARCHTEMALSATDPSRPGSVRVSDVERTARDLLARWSADSILEVAATTDGGESSSSTTDSAQTTVVPRATIPVAEPLPTIHDSREERIARRQRKTSMALVDRPPPPKSWTATIAQFVAYGGVAGVTYGAALILWSHFGGPAHYAPTGWLLATVGQMLLFLGLVTLVAGNLERYSEQMERRFDELAARLEQIELRRRRMRKQRRTEDVTTRAA